MLQVQSNILDIHVYLTGSFLPLSNLQFPITYFPLLHLTVHVVLVIFIFLVYTASKDLGSPKTVYNHLTAVSKSRVCSDPTSHHGQACGSVSGNYQGSYLTMLSSGGLVFGIINIVGNFGTVFVDNVSCCFVIFSLLFFTFAFLFSLVIIFSLLFFTLCW